jgi:hypothetical protein
MSVYMWKFHTIPEPKAVEQFIDAQMPLLSRNARHLTGGDGEPVVDLMRVEHTGSTLSFNSTASRGGVAMSSVSLDIIRAIWMTRLIPSLTAAIRAGTSMERS